MANRDRIKALDTEALLLEKLESKDAEILHYMNLLKEKNKEIKELYKLLEGCTCNKKQQEIK
jgi:hypothetical protein